MSCVLACNAPQMLLKSRLRHLLSPPYTHAWTRVAFPIDYEPRLEETGPCLATSGQDVGMLRKKPKHKEKVITRMQLESILDSGMSGGARRRRHWTQKREKLKVWSKTRLAACFRWRGDMRRQRERTSKRKQTHMVWDQPEPNRASCFGYATAARRALAVGTYLEPAPRKDLET